MARDMTRAQFKAAASRNGFDVRLLWLHDRETGIGYGLQLCQKTGVRRRESLARSIKAREADRAKARAALKDAAS